MQQALAVSVTRVKMGSPRLPVAMLKAHPFGNPCCHYVRPPLIRLAGWLAAWLAGSHPLACPCWLAAAGDFVDAASGKGEGGIDSLNTLLAAHAAYAA